MVRKDKKKNTEEDDLEHNHFSKAVENLKKIYKVNGKFYLFYYLILKNKKIYIYKK